MKARLKAKDAANAEAKAKMKKVLEQDDVMWQSDATQSRQDRSADPVMALVMEMADRAINDKKLLLCTTKCTHEKFLCILAAMTVWLNKHPEQAPLFRTDENNATQAGNRCKLYPRHVLLMVLQHYKNDLTQEGMTTIWRLDQSTISRYLKLAKSILKDIMPTADNLYQDIINATTVDELLKIIKYGKP